MTPHAKARLVNGAVALGGSAVLALAGVLRPDPSGVGTHRQLGLPPDLLLSLTGIPCPFCGMTTAFAHMAHGQPLRAFATQPAGAALFVLTIIAVAASAVLAVRGERATVTSLAIRLPRSAGWSALVFFLASWAYKIAVTL